MNELIAQFHNGTITHKDNILTPGIDCVPYEEGDTFDTLIEKYKQMPISEDKEQDIKGVWIVTKRVIDIVNNAVNNEKGKGDDKTHKATVDNGWRAIQLHSKLTLTKSE